MANLRQDVAEPDVEEQQRSLRLAKQNLSDFFGHKSYFCGGSIPDKLLYSKESLDFVLNTDFNYGVLYAQEFLIPQVPEPADFHKQILWDVHLVLELLHESWDAGISITAQAGIILLDFKFCRGLPLSRREYLEWLRVVSIAA